LPKEFKLAKRTSVHLDAIRGVSALAVMIYHLRGLFFADFPFVANKSLPIAGLYAITGYGHQAVMIFFVLSGYFIGSSVMESVGVRRWSWRKYLASRFTRLELVLFPSLVLGGLWDRIGMRIPQAAPIYFGGLYKFYIPSVALRSTVPIFLGNLFFLQSIDTPVFGSNTPLWSLSYEFWYYILFPVLLLVSVTWIDTRWRLFYAAFAVLLLWFIGPQTTFYFLIWLAGALLGRIQRASWAKPNFPGMALCTGLIFFGALAWLRTHRLSSDLMSDYLVAFCFVLWLYALLLGPRDTTPRGYEFAARKLAGFSYTLYLVHLPALILLRAVLDPQGDWQPDALHLGYASAIGLMIMLYAYGVAECTEAHTATVRRWLLQTLPGSQRETRS
jgi:peptidoglycan/LPS O-acetylase OafA/YrhL